MLIFMGDISWMVILLRTTSPHFRIGHLSPQSMPNPARFLPPETAPVEYLDTRLRMTVPAAAGELFSRKIRWAGIEYRAIPAGPGRGRERKN